MDITVKCNKLFIQDLPAGGSFSLLIFFSFKQNTSYRRDAFVPFMVFLVSLSTTTRFPVLPVGVICIQSGYVVETVVRVFLSVRETPTVRSVETGRPKWQTGHSLAGRDLRLAPRTERSGFLRRVGSSVLTPRHPGRAGTLRSQPLQFGPPGNNSPRNREGAVLRSWVTRRSLCISCALRDCVR